MSATRPGWTREQIAQRAAQDIADGSYVNLGIGIPEMIAQFVPPDREIVLHTENGLLGMGPPPAPGSGDPELINAGKRQVTATAGASYFHHADSFAMIRGGHLDLCVLGALQVAANGDLANWSTGLATGIPAVGGAMDLAVGARTVFAVTFHCTRDGTPKLVERCSYPLTGAGVVSRVFTDLAVLDVTPDGFAVIDLAPGVSLMEVAARTAAPVLDALPTTKAPGQAPAKT